MVHNAVRTLLLSPVFFSFVRAGAAACTAARSKTGSGAMDCPSGMRRYLDDPHSFGYSDSLSGTPHTLYHRSLGICHGLSFSAAWLAIGFVVGLALGIALSSSAFVLRGARRRTRERQRRLTAHPFPTLPHHIITEHSPVSFVAPPQDSPDTETRARRPSIASTAGRSAPQLPLPLLQRDNSGRFAPSRAPSARTVRSISASEPTSPVNTDHQSVRSEKRALMSSPRSATEPGGSAGFVPPLPELPPYPFEERPPLRRTLTEPRSA